MTISLDSKTIIRFLDKVIVDDGCWGWAIHKNPDGYGNFSLYGKTRSVHRISWKIFKGSIPKGLSILHHCDNPACTRPSHLFLGTQSDNMQDAFRKGRISRPHGDKHYAAKLNSAQVKEIRDSYYSGKLKQSDLVKKFSVVKSTIWKIVHNKKWTHLN